MLECNYSYDNINFKNTSLNSFIKSIKNYVDNKNELLIDEDTHYILLSSYNYTDSSIKDKLYRK